jgi:hypothetical protein
MANCRAARREAVVDSGEIFSTYESSPDRIRKLVSTSPGSSAATPEIPKWVAATASARAVVIERMTAA